MLKDPLLDGTSKKSLLGLSESAKMAMKTGAFGAVGALAALKIIEVGLAGGKKAVDVTLNFFRRDEKPERKRTAKSSKKKPPTKKKSKA